MRWLPLLLLTGCLPMTFAHEGVIDFERYRSVEVTVDGGTVDAEEYFIAELRRESGFETVTPERRDPVDLLLVVSVVVVTEITTDAEGNEEIEHVATAAWEAVTPTGHLVDAGDVTDESGSAVEAVHDVLDEVALHYLRPYRL